MTTPHERLADKLLESLDAMGISTEQAKNIVLTVMDATIDMEALAGEAHLTACTAAPMQPHRGMVAGPPAPFGDFDLTGGEVPLAPPPLTDEVARVLLRLLVASPSS